MSTYLITFYFRQDEEWKQSKWKITDESRSNALHKANLMFNYYYSYPPYSGTEDNVGMITMSKSGFNTEINESAFINLDDEYTQNKIQGLNKIWQQRFNRMENV